MSNGEQMYYLLDARSCVGNCASWWAPGGKGYVCDLRDAGRFTKVEAYSHRETDVPVPCHIAEAAVIHHVRVDTPAMSEFFGPANCEYWRGQKQPKRAGGTR